MQPGPIFMKLRATAFTFAFLASLTWIVLLSLELFLRGDVSDSTQRSLVAVMLIIDTVTVIMLPILLLLEFRPWLDAARMVLLLTAHFGIAIGFTTRNQKYECPEDSPDDAAVCRLVNMYILMGSWVVPALLLVYSVCLAVAAYFNRGDGQSAKAGKWNSDVEAVTPTQAELPIMAPPKNRASTQTTSASQYSRPSWPPASLPQPPPAQDSDGQDDAQEKDSSPRSSARLSKRLPSRFF